MMEYFCRNCGKTDIRYRTTTINTCKFCGYIDWGYDPNSIRETYFNGTLYLTEEGRLCAINQAKPLHIRKLDIPEGVTSLHSFDLEGAITNNSYIEEISLPSSLRKLGYDVFSGCSRVKRITFKSNESLPLYQPVLS